MSDKLRELSTFNPFSKNLFSYLVVKMCVRVIEYNRIDSVIVCTELYNFL